jgi:folate-binding protein YgfZ
VTNDVGRLPQGGAAYAALLTPQGKILFDFFVVANDDGLLLDCAAAQADALVKRLTLYRLRAKVEIARRDDLMVLASWDGAALPGRAFADPRLAQLGTRAIAAEVETAVAAGAEDYLAQRLQLGVPESGDFGQDRMFALDADLDELHAVAFDKGCYVGQELTARMKHRGTARKRLLPVVSVEGEALPAPDTAVMAEGKSIGEITSSYGARGFALIRLDRLEEANATSFSADDKAVALGKPRWLFA